MRHFFIPLTDLSAWVVPVLLPGLEFRGARGTRTAGGEILVCEIRTLKLSIVHTFPSLAKSLPTHRSTRFNIGS